MSLTVLNKKFLAVLLDLGIDLSQFPDKTFDGLFETSCNDSKDFLEWFCEYFSSDNVLTDEERSAYDELEHTRQLIPEENVEKQLLHCHPSYDDVQALDPYYVNNVLTDELDALNKEYQDLKDIKSSLELEYDEIKKSQNKILEENHKWKNNLKVVKSRCDNVNVNVNNSLKDMSFFLLKSPAICIDINLLDGVVLGKELFNVFSIDKDFSSLFNDQSNPYVALEDSLSVVEHHKITSQGTLEQKKVIYSSLEKIVKSRKSKDKGVMDSYFMPKDADSIGKLTDDILLIEKNELLSLAEKLAHLEISQLLSHFQLNKLYSVNNLTAKASYYKESLETIESFNLILWHILQRSVKNVEDTENLIFNFSAALNKNQLKENDKIEFAKWRSRRYHEVINTVHKNHPLVVALRKIVPDILENKNLGNIACDMKLFLENSAFWPEPLFDEMENYIKNYLGRLLCGPTKQLQFTEIEIQKKFQLCEYLLTQRKNEIKKLTNKYVTVKNAVAQGNRSKSLLWTLFLTNPEKLELVIKNMEKETLSLELKSSNGEITLF